MTAEGMLYTTHGLKKPQGELAIVNQKIALTYVKGSGENKTVVGYTYLDEIFQMTSMKKLPSYVVNF